MINFVCRGRFNRKGVVGIINQTKRVPHCLYNIRKVVKYLTPNTDEVLLGFGHGFLGFAQQIVSEVKNLRMNYLPSIGINICRIHIVDHDIVDSKGKFNLLENNEYVIYILGEEKVRKKCDPQNYKDIINVLKLIIEENRQKFTSTN